MAHPQVDGLLETWIWKLVGVLKSRPVNVGVVEWISLAYQHYAIAVRNTRVVGQEVAALLLWLEVSPPACSSDSREGERVSERSPCCPRRPQCAAYRSEARDEASLEHLLPPPQPPLLFAHPSIILKQQCPIPTQAIPRSHGVLVSALST